LWNFFWTSSKDVLWTSYKFFANLFWTSYELVTNYLWALELLANVLWNSEVLTRLSQMFLSLILNYLQNLTNFLQTFYVLPMILLQILYALLSFRTTCKCLMKFLRSSHNLLTHLSQKALILILNYLQTSLELLWTYFLWTSCKFLMNFFSFRTAFKCLMKCLWTSYNLLTRLSQMFLNLILIYLQTSLDLLISIFKTLMNFL